MKTINFVIFLIVVLMIYGSANFYIFIRGWQALPRELSFRAPYLVLFLLLSFSYIAGRVLERFAICAASEGLIWIGSFWFGLLLYLLLGVALCDLLRLLNWLAQIIPVPSEAYARAKQIAAAVVPAVAVMAVLAGYINTLHPRIRTLDIEIPKQAGGRQTLDIALATDIHLGTIISNSRLQKMVDMINGLHPDVVLLGGDIVDEDLTPVIENNLGELLRSIRSRYGTYAVTGNHEFYGGVGKACRYLDEHGVTVLRDRAVLIDGSFYLVGRDDRAISQVSDKKRMPLDELMKGVDRSLPVIMMDHQPLNLPEAAEHGVDLQLSGHTHHAQLWPASIVTDLIYEVSHGFKRIGGCAYYVSCGYGTWGPPARLGSYPEIVQIRVRFSR
ncbi:MAG: metallophosphoesterase [Spirochaetes bacterium]|nr:metallophosphoesterase [Spirochaetota bacterium]